eukprot:gene2440-2478_t
MPLVKPPELCDGQINDAEDGVSKEGAELSRIAPPGSILVSCIGNLGKIGINTVPVAFNQQVNAIYPDRAKMMPEFLFYQVLTNSFKDQLEGLASGTTIRIVNKSKFNSLNIVFPPLPEQRRIVAILDEAFEGLEAMRANAEQNLKNARELFDSYRNAIFTQKGEGWREAAFDEICIIESKLVDPRLAEFIDLPHVGAGNMVSKTGEIIDVQTARQEGLKSGKFLFDRNIVLYSKIRPYLMKACRPDFDGLCSADVYPLLPNQKHITRDFLFHLLMSSEFTEYAIAGSARAGMPKVNREHLFAYRVWLPNVEKQIELVKTLDSFAIETSNLESLYRQKLAAIAELKQSLLQKAFAGELTSSEAVAA